MGRDCIYRFLERNPDVEFVFNKLLERNRANAQDYMVINDNLTKVCIYLGFIILTNLNS